MVQFTTSREWPGKHSTEDGHQGHEYFQAGIVGLLVRRTVKIALWLEGSAEGRSLEAFLKF